MKRLCLRYERACLLGLIVVVALVLTTFLNSPIQRTSREVFPRFLEPVATTTWTAGGAARIEWTPVSTGASNIFYLELLSGDITQPGHIESHLQQSTNPSVSFTIIQLPRDLPPRTTYQMCFFSNDKSSYAGGMGARTFCSDEFSIYPKTVSEDIQRQQALQFSLPQRGQVIERGTVLTLAWPAFEKGNNLEYYVKLMLPVDGSFQDVLKQDVDFSDGRWAIALPQNFESGNGYVACMFGREIKARDEGEKLFCSDPFTIQ